MSALADEITYPDTLWEFVEQRAAATPDRVVLGDEAGRRVTVAQFRDAAEVMAAGLLADGIGPGTVVCWQLPTSIDTLVLLAALARIGAVQCPIIPILREREVRYITNEARCDVLIVRPQWRGFDYEGLARRVADDVGFRVMAVDTLPTGDPATLPAPPVADGTTRWLYYTSGSTADPKGAWHTDVGLMAAGNTWFSKMQPTKDDIYPVAFPVGHIGGASMLVVTLASGMCMILLEAFDAEKSPIFMAEQGATLLGTAVPFFRAYLAAQAAHGSEKLFPNLRACVGGGAPTPPALHEDVKRELGGIGIIGSWGLTEFPIATCGAVTDTDEQIASSEGTAGPGVEVRVVGLDGLDKGPGEEGELRLRGPQLFHGYANPALNDGALDDQGFFHTGDLGIVTDTGHVLITGRVKDIIIRNAENISASEIEDALHLHPKIADVAVIALPDDRTGERACAVVKLADGVESITLVEIGDHCRDLGLARQKVPEQLELVDEVPRNAMGKIQKPELKKRYAPTP
jgi:acyl-CoA synthetase (AMP-forming)/AMP-acid ligase II